jgi:glycosyltransferase involved in cell wall biosynthesis
MAEPAPLLVFADDWGRHPSSCQHLVTRLLDHRRVVWVNTIGTRPPRLNWSTVTRGFEKLRSWFLSPSGGRQPPELGELGGLTPPAQPLVLNPKMWPSFRSRFGRGLNRRLLVRALRPVVESLPAPPIVVTTLPLVADLVGVFPAAKWVYYCVDDFGVWPGLDGRTLQRMESELVAKVDRVIAVSETLQTHIAKLGKPSELLTHGVDLEHFRCAPGEPASGVLFWGVIDRRMDLAFLRRLSERTGCPIHLVGPQDNPDPEVFRLPRVEVRPAVSYDELPALAAAASVLIMPYADLPVTRAMQPLKLKEYLATGKPVVVRKLPATESWSDCCDVCDSPDSFADAVIERMTTGVPADQIAARSRLAAESWDAKARQFEEWLA